MQKQIIECAKAPAPIGPYSQAVIYNDILYISGQIAIDSDSGEFKNSSIDEEAELVMKNLQAILLKSGSGFANVLKSSIFLQDMNDFSAVNDIYAKFFKEQPPARETVAVQGLPKGARVEISMIAAVPSVQ